MTIALKWINLAAPAQQRSIQNSNHRGSGVVLFSPMSSHFIPSENGSGDKKDAGETHQVFLRSPFYCVNNSQLC